MGAGSFAGNYGINAYDMPMTYEGHLQQLMSELTQYAAIPSTHTQGIASFTTPWSNGRTPYDVSRNRERDRMPVEEGQQPSEVQYGEWKPWYEDSNYTGDTPDEPDYDVDSGITGEGQIEALKQQEGTSGKLVDKLLEGD